MGIPGLFERVFTSYQLALRKPDPAIYLHVTEALAVEPQAVLFFDDNPANVDAALDLGMQAVCVRGPEGVRTHLEEHDLL
jgi:putative hydrolase of the HAD superfamily